MSRLQFNHTARDPFTQSIFEKKNSAKRSFLLSHFGIAKFFRFEIWIFFFKKFSLEIWILFCELNQKKILEIRHWQKSKNNYLIGRKCAGLIDITKWPVYAVLWKMIEAVGLCNNFLILSVANHIQCHDRDNLMQKASDINENLSIPAFFVKILNFPSTVFLFTATNTLKTFQRAAQLHPNPIKHIFNHNSN